MELIAGKQGDVVFREYDMGDAMYRVREGAVRIVARCGTEEEQELTVLTEGAYFGEMSLLESWVRSATAVVASETATLEKIAAKELDDYFAARSERIMDIMRHLSGRLRALTADYRDACATLDELRPGGAPQSEGLAAKVRRFAAVFIAGRKEAEALKTAAQADAPRGPDETEPAPARESLSAGDVLFREGDAAQCMYELRRGQVGVYCGYGTPEQRQLTVLSPGSFFGEMGLIDRAPRSAAAVALKNGTLVEAIGEADLAGIFREDPDRIYAILRQLVLRLRQLTAAYLEACRLIAVLGRADGDDADDADREEAERLAKGWWRSVPDLAAEPAFWAHGFLI